MDGGPERLTLLQRLAERLARLHAPQEAVHEVVSEALAATGARWGAVMTAQEQRGAITAIAVGGHEGQVPAARTLDLTADAPAAEAVRLGHAVYRAIAGEHGETTDVALPLENDAQKPAGVLLLRFDGHRSFPAEERTFLDAVAAQCSETLERARLYAAAELALARLAFLAEASSALSADLDVDATVAKLAVLAVPRIADCCSVHLITRSGELPLLALTHRDADRLAVARQMIEEYPPELGELVGVGGVVRTGEELILLEITDDMLAGRARDQRELALLHKLNFRSVMLLPLRARDRIVGALSLFTSNDRRFSADDVALGRELATRAALALDNAVLFTERSEVVQSLRAALLPPRLPVIPGLDIGTAHVAAGRGFDLGGDFYDAFQLTPDRWMVAIGDVRGKGADAASITGLVRHTLRAAAVDDPTPSQVLERINRVLLGAPDEIDEPRFCTVLAATVTSAADGTNVVFASAGHPLPMVRRQDGSITDEGHTGAAAGLLPEVGAPDIEVRLGVGEAFIACTDGITERHAGRRYFGSEGVRTAISATAGGSAPELALAVLDAARLFTTGEPHDDMAVLAILVLGSQSAATVFPGTRQAAREARRFVGEVLENWGEADRVEPVRLCVSELVTNALLNSDGDVTVRLTRFGRVIRVGVRDTSEAMPSGQRLRLVRSLAHAWGADTADGEKEVWCELLP